jgi:hypothetical protein
VVGVAQGPDQIALSPEHFRVRPIEIESQRLSDSQRGGFSLEQPSDFPR